MDVHSAPSGATDSWFFAGDSIIQFAAEYNDAGGMSAVMSQQIADALPQYYPVWQDGGISGYTATDLEAIFAPTWLPLFPGKYVVLAVGKNDATGGGALVTNFSAKMQSMITSILAAGKTPVLPSIPYGSVGASNIATLNSQIAALVSANPGAIAGPDLYAYFNANQSLIDTDGIHPTNPTGYNAYRTQWVNWAIANIYTASTQYFINASHKRHRTTVL
jgi:lysophospholipase L1-like esterase